MVPEAQAQRLTLSELRRSFPQSLQGATLEQLMVPADALGPLPRPLRLGLEELPALQAPAVLH